jgi:hypothetical protein
MLLARLLAHYINHGIQMDKNASITYLYYLSQIGIAVSPMSNNCLFLEYNQVRKGKKGVVMMAVMVVIMMMKMMMLMMLMMEMMMLLMAVMMMVVTMLMIVLRR